MDRRGFALPVVFVYGLLIVAFCGAFMRFYIPGKGFSYLISFGSQMEDSRLSKIRNLDYYMERDSSGYDAQYYAQIAMDPSLQNSQLRHAVDSLPYRARRILMPAVAHVFGLGQPAAILQAYAVINAVCWLALAALLLHWFPPKDWNNFYRWAGVLFSFGLCISVRNALTDGPSLLLLATGVYFLERGRSWLATGVLALSGLAKETNLLAAAALLPRWGQRPREMLAPLFRAALVAAPLALWIAYIWIQVGSAADPGARNFDLPGFAFWRKSREVFAGLPNISWAGPGAFWSLCMLIALVAQLAFFVSRPRWNDAWWRIGLSYGVLMIVLGDAVWEGYPGAASRVLLPMQLAFNILVPAGRYWNWLLLAGNLTILAAPATLERPVSNEGYVVHADSNAFDGVETNFLRVQFSPAWHLPEQGRLSYRIWAQGDAEILLHNPQTHSLNMRLRFELNGLDTRDVRLRLNGKDVWSVFITEGTKVSVSVPFLDLVAGDNVLEFITDQPPVKRPPDPRELAFCLHNLEIELETPGS